MARDAITSVPMIETIVAQALPATCGDVMERRRISELVFAALGAHNLDPCTLTLQLAEVTGKVDSMAAFTNTAQNLASAAAEREHIALAALESMTLSRDAHALVTLRVTEQFAGAVVDVGFILDTIEKAKAVDA